jgi:hypothetical protein
MQNDQDAAKVDVEKGALQPSAAPLAASEPHSIYTKNQKRMMVVAAAIASTFSPITGNIYLPALNSVAHDLNVSNSVVTLTVTFYMVSISGMVLVFSASIRSKPNGSSAPLDTLPYDFGKFLFSFRCTVLSNIPAKATSRSLRSESGFDEYSSAQATKPLLVN